MTIKKLVVEVINARNLMPKDGQGSSSAYVQVDFDGLRKRTRIIPKDLNPVWEERIEFQLRDPLDMVDELLEVTVINDSKRIGRRSNFLGRVRLSGGTFVKLGEEAVMCYALEKRGLFSLVKGDLYMKIYYMDETAAVEGAEKSKGTNNAAAVVQQPPAPPSLPSQGEPPVPPPPSTTPASPLMDANTAPPIDAAPTSPTGAAPATAPADAPSADPTASVETPAAATAGEPAPPAATTDEATPQEALATAASDAADPPPPTPTVADAPPPPAPREGPKVEVIESVARGDVQLDVNASVATAPAAASVMSTRGLVSATDADYILKDTRRSLGTGSGGEKMSTYDLVERMHYLFVRVVKAHSLAVKDITGSSDPYVRIRLGNQTARTRTLPRNLNPEWNQVFAFGKDRQIQAGIMEVSVWDEDEGKSDDFLGVVYFDLAEIPTRVPPDSPLAPQWYRLEQMRGQGRAVKGDIMLAVWLGTQADEAFPEAWQSDTGGLPLTRSKVYLSPKLWYLRVNVIEAQDLQGRETGRLPEVSVKAQLGFQATKTRVAKTRSASPFWNEDLVVVAAEPLEEPLILTLEDHHSGDKHELLGVARIPLHLVERRVDDRQVRNRDGWKVSCLLAIRVKMQLSMCVHGCMQVASRWFNLQRSLDGKESVGGSLPGRVHVRLCLDGGYHVMDEAAQLSSDVRPSARQLWKPAVGLVELGIIGANNLLPMKTKEGRGTTDAYCVAKYGPKWVRTRTILDDLSPRWNEQYTWEVFDPCTVITLCVFDNGHVERPSSTSKRDARIGKVRIRLSTLETDRIYTLSYPLLVLQPGGVKKMGHIELALRFSCPSLFNLIHTYSTPLLPRMHYLHPLPVHQQALLRNAAMRIVALRLSRSEPPLRPEVVQYLLDSDSSLFSVRRSKANWSRIGSFIAGFSSLTKWFHDICQWRNPLTTILVHILFLILLSYPELILPTVFFYMFLIGLWQYRFRPRSPPHMDPRISHAELIDQDELEEEFDTVPTSKPPEVVMMRYERLRGLAGRIQTYLGDVASQGERVQGLLTWRDPRATVIFIVFCFLSAVALYVAQFRIVAFLLGMYSLRHPRFRDPVPPIFLNFFRRLPAQSDRML